MTVREFIGLEGRGVKEVALSSRLLSSRNSSSVVSSQVSSLFYVKRLLCSKFLRCMDDPFLTETSFFVNSITPNPETGSNVGCLRLDCSVKSKIVLRL